MHQYLNLIHKYAPTDAYIGLTTIINQRVTNQWFPANKHADLIAAALKIGNRANVYVRLTPVVKPPVHGRGTEDDALGSSVLWLDYDAYLHQSEAIETLQNMHQPPTMIVNSGFGLHAYWLLSEFCTDLDVIKACNIGLMHEINNGSLEEKYADSCFDLARILRLPGSYNLKTDDLFECTIIHYDETLAYTINQFTQAVLPDLPIVEAWDTEPLSLDFIDTIRERDKRLYARIVDENRARKADAPVNTNGHIDRSVNDAYIATRLLGLGFTVGVCMSVLMQTQWLAGSKYNETRRYDYVVSTVNEAYRHYQQNNDKYFIKNVFQSSVFGKEINTQANFLYTAEKLWRYVDGVYKPDGVEWLRARVLQRLGKRWHSRAADEAVTWIVDACKNDVTPCNQHEGYINVLNGMINLSSGELIAHSPMFRSLAQLPITYNPDACTQQLDTFIVQILPEDAINTFWEYIGSTFIRKHYWPKAFLSLIGPKNCGKSKILEWLLHFFGNSNVATKTFQSLADNRFATAALYGKLANIYDDLDESEAQNVGLIKALTGDTASIDGERKFQDSFSFKNTARLIFTANHYIKVKAPDDAYFSRVNIIACTNQFTKATADPNIIDKLTTPENLSAGLIKAIEGYRRLLAQNGLSTAASIQAQSDEYRFSADTVQGFLHTCTFDVDYKCLKSQLWDHYRVACEQSNRKPVSEDAFFKRVKENLDRFGMSESYDLINSATGERKWRYHGRKPVNVVYSIATPQLKSN